MIKQSLSILPRALSALLLAATACSRSDVVPEVVQAASADPQTLFTQLPSSVTGIAFENRLRDSKNMNVFAYRNYYNGGGAAIGDLTGDGLPEVILTANQGGPRLYLNGGAFRFRDVTRASGFTAASNSWTTGVVLADVNSDGRLDVYICRAGPLDPAKRGNQLWIHQGLDGDGVPTFEESAEAYGVADQGYSIHAAFLDFDRDGDLDLFVINNSPRPVSSFGLRNMRHERDAHGGAKFFRNDGARFTDISAAAGVHSPEIAFGLGIAVGDVNRDGWPDVYVANDFFERDYLYLNRGNGTFSEGLDKQAPVLSYFSMGLDIADVDNDGWPDVYTTDMLPEDEVRFKTTTMFEGWDIYWTKVRNGYHHQLMRNMLQRNNGDGTFTDVGQQGGVARTDWSWSALIADLDLDGFKDIFVTNGLAKDITSQDYVAFLANEETMKEVTSGGTRKVDFDKLTRAMSSTPLANYAFHNNGGTTFSNAAAAWGLAAPSFSNGAAYGDLDGDGALDLVVNNVNQEAFVYRNNARALHRENRSVRVQLLGEGKNPFAVGARVTVHAGAAAFMQEQAPSRGFQSSVDYVLIFGVGRNAVDSVVVVWPDWRVSTVRSPALDRLVTVRQAEAAVPAASAAPRASGRTLLSDVTAAARISFAHKENDFVDFDRERLIPKMLSTEGPFLAVGDVNGDGLDDMFIGGAKDQPGEILLQQRDGTLRSGSRGAFEADRVAEDVGAALFDADGDGDRDLYVVSGGNEFTDLAPGLQDRLYLNDGRGNFAKAARRLPDEFASGSRVVPADYDADGDIDLFVGGRVVPWRYGTDPRSALLRNDGRGTFTDVTDAAAPALARAGMVTDAVWRDLDGDRRLDLVVVGEWMPVMAFRNAGAGKLEPLAVRGLEKSNGWWNRIVARDVTGDGRVDFVLGNLGLNTRLQASATRPATMYVKDFDRNGFVEQILSCYNDSLSYPVVLRDDLIKTVPSLKARFLNYKDYARKTVGDIFPPAELKDAVMKEAFTFASSIARSNGDGSYTLVALPAEAQVAPVYGIVVDDVDRDGRVDLLLAGNFDGFKPEIGRAASSRGLLLRGDGTGGFVPAAAAVSGFLVPGQARDIQRLNTPRGAAYVVARNNDTPLVFRASAEGQERP
jgi:hypothetical protein